MMTVLWGRPLLPSCCQGEGWLKHDGSHYPFVTFRRHFHSGDAVISRNFKWSARFDDLAECVGVQLKDA